MSSQLDVRLPGAKTSLEADTAEPLCGKGQFPGGACYWGQHCLCIQSGQLPRIVTDGIQGDLVAFGGSRSFVTI